MRPATIFSAVLLVLVALPMRENHRDEPEDGFPLSYYPMFSNDRKGETRLTHPVGIRADGSEVPLLWRLAGGGGMNQVRHVIRRREKAGESEALCREIARRLRERGNPDGVVEVMLVRDRFDLERFMSGDRTPRSRRVRARVHVREDGR